MHASFIESPLSAARMRLALRTQAANDNVSPAFAQAPKATLPARQTWRAADDSESIDSVEAPWCPIPALRAGARAANPLPCL